MRKVQCSIRKVIGYDMRSIEQLIEVLRSEAQSNHAFRNALQLLVALGEEILRASPQDE